MHRYAYYAKINIYIVLTETTPLCSSVVGFGLAGRREGGRAISNASGPRILIRDNYYYKRFSDKPVFCDSCVNAELISILRIDLMLSETKQQNI